MSMKAGRDSSTTASTGDPEREERPHQARRQPMTVDDAIGMALSHGRAALAEALLAARAFLDAASIALFGEPAALAPEAAGRSSDARLALATLARGIDELVELAGSGSQNHPDVVLRAVLDALDREIKRWEVRSQTDPDARAVLRAFLGLREILWEFGVRPPESHTADRPDTESEQKRPGASGSRRAARSSRPIEPDDVVQSGTGTSQRGGGRRVQRVKVRS